MNRPVRRLLLALLAVFLCVAALALVRTARLDSKQIDVDPAPLVDLDHQAILGHLAEAISFPTVSLQERAAIDDEAFAGFHRWLALTYPGIHATLEIERVGSHGLLYRWPGADPSLPPAVLMAHQDVVPVLGGTEKDWQERPFSGARTGGYLWGRGALDDKGPLIAMLEAAEHLATRGHRPRRTVWLALGHDEEIGGSDGARRMASLIAARGPEPALVLDEGGALTEGLLPLESPVAVVGIAEKGYATLKLTAHGVGGHSSTPPPDSAIPVLADALRRLHTRPFPAALAGPSAEMFETLAPEMGFPIRLLVANRWLFGPILTRVLGSDPTTAAMMRTTTAPTMLQAGEKDNVLPITAEAWVNFRIHPRDSIESVVAHVRDAVAGTGVEVELTEEFASEPSPVSPTDGDGFRTLARSIREVFPGTIVAPYLVMAGTDARHMNEYATQVYRFSPLKMASDDMQRIHGTNERVREDSMIAGVRFYVRLLENLDGEL